MIVVADTSPLNYLILIGEIEILQALYERVLIPRAVIVELSSPQSPDQVLTWVKKPPAWLEQKAVSVQAMTSIDESLDPGEREALALAVQEAADVVLIDDRSGRKAARRLDLLVTGTIGVLRAASERGLVDFGVALRRLRRTSFHFPKEFESYL